MNEVRDSDLLHGNQKNKWLRKILFLITQNKTRKSKPIIANHFHLSLGALALGDSGLGILRRRPENSPAETKALETLIRDHGASQYLF
jgi:hypothetical protein